MSESVMRNTDEVMRVLSRGDVLDQGTLRTVRRMLELDDVKRVRKPLPPGALGPRPGENLGG